MKLSALALTLALLTAACAPFPPATPMPGNSAPQTAPASAASVEASIPPAPSEEPVSEAGAAADTSEPDTAAHKDSLWVCPYCSGTQAWQFENGMAQQIDLPVEFAYAYGYSPATGRLLYSPPHEAIGGGPSGIAVNALWMLDVVTGEATPLFEDQVVVEADLAPDGEHFAYVLATDTTYELRWRAIGGKDKQLATDVAFTFAVSPQVDKVAFTRESNYGLPGAPGLYVVDVATGEEIKIADADRAGAGSIDDKPAWSPSGTRILLPTYGTTTAPGIVLAAADGSGAVTVGFDPATSTTDWYEVALASPYWVTDTQFLASATPNSMSQQLGGDLHLYLFQLNTTADTIVAGAEIGPGLFAGWDVPGESIWVQLGSEMQSVPLPELAPPDN